MLTCLEAILFLVAVLLLPFLVGRVFSGTRQPGCHALFFGLSIIGLWLSLSLAFHVPFWGSLMLLILTTGILLCLHPKRRKPRNPSPADRLSYACFGFAVLFMLGILVQGYLHVLSHPITRWDAVAIWYNKTKALSSGAMLSTLPVVNYPLFGPSLWDYVLKITRTPWEEVGRLVFPTFYFYFFISQWAWVSTRKQTALGALLIPLVAWRFFHLGPHTDGYQDGLLMLMGGSAGLFFSRRLSRDDSARGIDSNLWTAMFFLACMGFIKNEGAVMALILSTAFCLTEFLTMKHASRWRPWVAFTGTIMLLTLLLSSLWTGMLLVNGVDIKQVQGDAFTAGALLNIFNELTRWPMIRPFMESYFRGHSHLLAACLIMGLLTIVVNRRAIRVLLFLTMIWTFHIGFVIVTFLTTRQDLNWHLSTAFDRLVYHHEFVYILAMIGIPMLAVKALDDSASDTAGQ